MDAPGLKASWIGKGGLLRWKLLVAGSPPTDGSSCACLVASGPQASPPLRWILLRWSGHLRPTGLPGLPQGRAALRLVSTLGTLPPSVPVGGVSGPVEAWSRVTWSATPTSLEWPADRKLEQFLHPSLASRGCFSSACACAGRPQSLDEAYNASSLIWKKYIYINTNVVFNVSW